MTPSQYTELKHQIGFRNIMAICGGKMGLYNGDMVMQAGQGYYVRIELAPSDTYTVHREYKRGTIKVMGTVDDIYCDQISEIAYQASCYVNVDFGGHVTRRGISASYA